MCDINLTSCYTDWLGSCGVIPARSSLQKLLALFYRQAAVSSLIYVWGVRAESLNVSGIFTKSCSAMRVAVIKGKIAYDNAGMQCLAVEPLRTKCRLDTTVVDWCIPASVGIRKWRGGTGKEWCRWRCGKLRSTLCTFLMKWQTEMRKVGTLNKYLFGSIHFTLSMIWVLWNETGLTTYMTDRWEKVQRTVQED